MLLRRLQSRKVCRAFEHVPAEHSFFTETCPDEHREQGCWKRRPVSGEIVVSLIDWRGAEERHYDDFQEKFQREPERRTDD
jgi:hypothetical protein